MKQLLVLLRKDMRLEFRRKEAVIAMVSLALLLSVVVSFALSSAFLNPGTTLKIFCPLVWVLFLFWSTLTVGRSVEYEFESGCIEGLLLTRTAPEIIFLAKVIHNFVLTFLVQVLSVALLELWLGVEGRVFSSDFLIIIALATGAYTPLATLLATMTATARLKNVLLPLILLPLLIPTLFAAVELSTELLLSGQVPWSGFWGCLLAILPLMYTLICAALFKFTVR